MKEGQSRADRDLPERYVPSELRQNVKQTRQQVGDAQVQDEEVHPGELAPLVTSPGV